MESRPTAHEIHERRQRAHRALGGFSLIEVMVVVAMMSILAALAFPELKELTLVASEPREVASAKAFFAQARDAARRLNRCVRVVRETDGSALTWAPFTDGTTTCPAVSITEGNKFKIAGSMRLEPFAGATDADTLIFQRTGGTSYGTTSSIGLSRMRNGTSTAMRLLLIMPGTGSVKQ